MTAIDSMASATELKCHHDRLQELLLQVKRDVLTEQKKLFENYLLGLLPPSTYRSQERDGSYALASSMNSSIPNLTETFNPYIMTSSFTQPSAPFTQPSAGTVFTNSSDNSEEMKAKHRSNPSIDISQAGSGSNTQERSRSFHSRRGYSWYYNRRSSRETRPDQEKSIPAEETKSLPATSRKTQSSVKTFGADAIKKMVLVEERPFDSYQSQSDLCRSAGYYEALSALPFRAASCVTSPTFDSCCCLVILLNSLLIGVETEILAREGTNPKAIFYLQLAFNLWYFVELLLRFACFKMQFWCGVDRYWNLFDLILVVGAIFELCLSVTGNDNFSTFSHFRALRLIRIVRTLRIIRSVRSMPIVRKIVYSLVSSLPTLCWSLLLIGCVMYMFSLWFTQSAAFYCLECEDETCSRLRAYYHSMGQSLYTLFGAIAGGYSWHQVLDPWINTNSHASVMLFFVYITLSIFGLLNVVTSIFVDSAMQATRHFQELLVDAKKRDQQMYTYHLERIFRAIDTDKGGTLTVKEMSTFLENNAELPDYLEALGVSSSDVWVLFKLLDTDGSGLIDIKEFCEGCLRLKGEAKSFDVNCMIYESRAMMHMHSRFMDFVEDRLNALEPTRLMGEVDRCISMRLCALNARMEFLWSPTGQKPPQTPAVDGHLARTPRLDSHLASTPRTDVYSPGPLSTPIASPPASARRGVSQEAGRLYSPDVFSIAPQPKSLKCAES